MAEAARAREVELKLQELEQLKAAQQMNQQAMDNATNVMRELFDEGLLRQTDEDGKVVPVKDFQEYQQVKEMKMLEAQSQQSQQLSMAPSSQTQQIPMGSSLVEGNTSAQAYLPDQERSRPGMQLEQMDDQPMTVQAFMNRADEDDQDKYDGSQEGLL